MTCVWWGCDLRHSCLSPYSPPQWGLCIHTDHSRQQIQHLLEHVCCGCCQEDYYDYCYCCLLMELFHCYSHQHPHKCFGGMWGNSHSHATIHQHTMYYNIAILITVADIYVLSNEAYQRYHNNMSYYNSGINAYVDGSAGSIVCNK